MFIFSVFWFFVLISRFFQDLKGTGEHGHVSYFEMLSSVSMGMSLFQFKVSAPSSVLQGVILFTFSHSQKQYAGQRHGFLRAQPGFESQLFLCISAYTCGALNNFLICLSLSFLNYKLRISCPVRYQQDKRKHLEHAKFSINCSYWCSWIHFVNCIVYVMLLYNQTIFSDVRQILTDRLNHNISPLVCIYEYIFFYELELCCDTFLEKFIMRP